VKLPPPAPLGVKAKVWLERVRQGKGKIPTSCPFCHIHGSLFPVHYKECTYRDHGLCPNCMHPIIPGELHWAGCPVMGGKP
jgi:hypothetical protein